jgi:hypothetical protein
MKNKLSIPLLLALAFLSSFIAPPAEAVYGRPSAVTFLSAGGERFIYAFVKGNDGHLVSNHFNGTYWTWTDHGLPPGATAIHNPRAVAYTDAEGKRRIYVFAITSSGRLVIRFHKGAGYNWQWSDQGGPNVWGSSLSATTFVDDNGVRRIYAFAYRDNAGAVPLRLTTNFWNGNGWSWADLNTLSSQPTDHLSFTEVTNYIGNDGRRRMDVFSEAGSLQKLMRHSWVAGSWTLSNLDGQAYRYATAVNYTNTSGLRQVHAFVYHPAYETIWDRNTGAWSEVGIPAAAVGKPQGYISATTHVDGSGFPNINLFVERDNRLYRRQKVNTSWQPWVDLGVPSSAGTGGVEYPSAVTYVDSDGEPRHWVFMTGGPTNALYVMFFNGTSWNWFIRGNPP